MSEKYPRTKHLPWSPGGTSDDKRLSNVDSFLNKELIITEKIDGSNTCFNLEGAFSRSHSGAPIHASFNMLKVKYGQIKHLLKEAEDIFNEYAFAVHSIEYSKLPSYFFTIGVRVNKVWLSFDEMTARANELDLITAPVLWRGVVKTAKELEALTMRLAKEKSLYGQDREGIVLRLADSFTDFENSTAKIVRKNHVQTDEHWMNQEIKKQKLDK